MIFSYVRHSARAIADTLRSLTMVCTLDLRKYIAQRYISFGACRESRIDGIDSIFAGPAPSVAVSNKKWQALFINTSLV